jgi:hypothetical protein
MVKNKQKEVWLTDIKINIFEQSVMDRRIEYCQRNNRELLTSFSKKGYI